MSAFALYRLPHEQHFTMVEQTCGMPLELSSLSELNGRRGFVVAPFAVTDSEPLLLIRGDRVEQHLLTDRLELQCELGQDGGDNSSRETYSIDFANYHAHLVSGDFQKIVLARSAKVPLQASQHVYDLFLDACRRYPRMFVCLVSTKRSRTWLTATPEILLSSAAGKWQTIALAGTMQLEGDDLNSEGEHVTWGIKNIQEQRYVATYITECLERFAEDFTERGPYTVRAGNLVHLRSDFTFTLPDTLHLGDVLMTLHPTPAVCGLPKRQTFDFIRKNEHTPRHYYSGFMGPLQLPATHLYVSLRCMQLLADGYRLYAGGGLLPDSTEEQEWQETEAKMETMRSLLVHNS